MRALTGILVALAIGQGQSFFNTRGLGELGAPADARSLALGSPAALSYLNPGILVRLDRSAFLVSGIAAGTYGSTDGAGRLIGNVRPAGFVAAIPLPLGLRIQAGVDERFNQDFDIWQDSAPGQPYRYRVTGNGGIYTLRAGLAWSVLDLVCAGVEYGRAIGASREDWRFQLSGETYSSTDTVEVDYAGDALKAGLSFQTERFGIGAFFDAPLELEASSYRLVNGRVEDSITRHRLSIPWTLAVGANASLTNRVDVSAGLEYRPWSDITIDDTASAYGFRDALRASAGVSFGVAPGWPVRLGYSYTDWYYLAAGTGKGSAPYAHAVHLGTSVPVPGFGSIDIGAEVARRTDGNLTETVGRVMLGLSYREAWLRRTRRWGS